jgi:hypothetical protein
MKKKESRFGLVLGAAFFAALIFSVVSTVSAQQPSPNGAGKAPETGGVKNKAGAPADIQADPVMEINGTKLPSKPVKEKNNKGQVSAQIHRSVVANFVKSLLAVSGREGGIGEQVREIAKSQNESRESTARAIEAVQGRSKWKTFFFGSDWNNLGDLRSEMVKARKDIDQLIRLADKTENPENKAELKSQIMALQVEQARVQDFITANEKELGVVGWITRLFR